MGRSTGKSSTRIRKTTTRKTTAKTLPWHLRTTSPRNALGQPDRKRRGEASEAAFIARAVSLNLPVAKPWGESDAVDILIGTGKGRLYWRVQVKCACIAHPGGEYEIKGGGRHLYTEDHIDFLAAHIVPENAWYIVPIHAFQGRPFLYLYPHKRRSRGRYEKYFEAWCLLACDPESRGPDDIPAQCRCRPLPVRCAHCPEE